MKLRIELELPAYVDLSTILEDAQRFAVQLAADHTEAEDCKRCTATEPDVDCPDCDGTGIVEHDYDNEMSPESQKISESVSVEEVHGP